MQRNETMKRAIPYALILLTAVPALAAAPVGWRTDWTGRYPDADPPTKWSASENVVWKTPMPSWSNSTPVIVGERLFVCSEPTTLLCVNVKSGKIIWEKDNSYLETLPPAERAKTKALMDQIDIDGTTKALRDAQAKLSRVQGQLNRINRDPNLAAQKEQLAGQLQPQIQQHQQRVTELNDKLKPVSRFVMPNSQTANGYSSPTPVSDGRHVWVLFGTGTAACYDLDGNRKWIKFVEKPKDDYGHSTSPLLVGGNLIVHVLSLTALDKATGEQSWRSSARNGWGTGVVAKIGGEDVIITHQGDWFRARDGQKFADRTHRTQYNQPVLHDGVVYFVENGGKAFRLPASTADKPERLWQCNIRKDRYYSSPAYHDGLLYNVTQFGVFSAVDAKTGSRVYEQKLDFGQRRIKQCYSSVTLAGKHLHVSTSSGITILVEPGRQFKQVARNTLGEDFRCSPVFVGKRMYIRSLKHLWCIGR